MALKQKHPTPNHPDPNNPITRFIKCAAKSHSQLTSGSPGLLRESELGAEGDWGYWCPSPTVSPSSSQPWQFLPPWAPFPSLSHHLEGKAVGPCWWRCQDITCSLIANSESGPVTRYWTVLVDVWVLASQLVRPFVGLFYYLRSVWIMFRCSLSSFTEEFLFMWNSEDHHERGTVNLQFIAVCSKSPSKIN